MSANVETIEDEEWKDIEDLDSVYQVSNFGRVRKKSNHRIKAIVWDGRYYKFGYDYPKDGMEHKGWYRVHRAVAKAFIPNPLNKKTVNHIDGDRRNNRVDNLEWATYKEQSEHSVRVLKNQCGENNYNAQYTNEQVREIRRLFEKEGWTVSQIKERFGGRVSNIRKILNYERWKYI